jgi:hypothetical protein
MKRALSVGGAGGSLTATATVHTSSIALAQLERFRADPTFFTPQHLRHRADSLLTPWS